MPNAAEWGQVVALVELVGSVVVVVVDVEVVVEVDDVVEVEVLDVVDDVELDDDDVDRGTVVDVVVGVVEDSVAFPTATPIPAPANNNTNAMAHTDAGLMRSPCP